MSKELTQKEQETEFQRRRNLPSVEVRRMFANKGKIMDVVLYCRERGKEIGWLTEITRKGKVGRSFLLPDLDYKL